MKIAASQKLKLELLCALFTCTEEKYPMPSVAEAIVFRVRRARAGGLGHSDLSSIFSYKGRSDGVSGCRQGGPLSLFSFCTSSSYSATNVCTRKQDPHLTWELLKILYNFINIPFQ